MQLLSADFLGVACHCVTDQQTSVSKGDRPLMETNQSHVYLPTCTHKDTCGNVGMTFKTHLGMYISVCKNKDNLF